MRIISSRPCPWDERTVALVSIEFDSQLKLYDVAIRRAADGTLRAWPPRNNKGAVASISSDLARSIISAAMPVIEGGARHADS